MLSDAYGYRRYWGIYPLFFSGTTDVSPPHFFSERLHHHVAYLLYAVVRFEL